MLRAALLFVGLVAVGVLPFVVWDPGAFWADTIEYGGKTYRIVGYGLSGLLVKASLIDRRTDPYPFLPLLVLVWLPLTAWLLWLQRRVRDLWFAAAGFAVSIFTLVFLGRVFQPSYLVWPLVGIAMAFAFAGSEAAPAGAAPGSRARLRQEEAEQREHECGGDQACDEQAPAH